MEPLDPGLSDLIAALLAGIGARDPWSDFLERLGTWLDASFATLILTAPGMATPGTFISPGADPEASSAYLATYFRGDPFRGLPEGQVISFREWIQGLSGADLERYRGFLDAVGGDQVLGADLAPAPRFEARLRVTRVRTLPDFTRAERAALQSIVPHVRTALRLHARLQRLDAERAAWRGAIETMGVATVIVDADGTIVDGNAGAEALLVAGDGIGRNRGRLWFTEAGSRAAFERLLAAPDPHGAPVRLRVDRVDGPPLTVVARPMPAPSPGSDRRAIALLMAVAGDDPRVGPQAMRQLYGLTPAEARLAAELSGGRSLPEAARTLGIAHGTARVHLRAIFAKTGARRQSHLVSLLRLATG